MTKTRFLLNRARTLKKKKEEESKKEQKDKKPSPKERS